MLYPAGDTENMQINTVIGEHETVSFILWRKSQKPYELFGQLNYVLLCIPIRAWYKENCISHLKSL